MSRPLRLVIDTDGGTDDAVAIWWALTDPGVELLALIATWGNVSRDVAAVNCNRILTAAGRSDILVALGAEGPIGGSPVPAGAGVAIHGEDGLGGHAASWPVSDVTPIEEPAGIFLPRLIAEQPGEVALAVLGPLSTLAGALQADAALASRVGDLAVMGGAIALSGNVLPVGEVNIANDPEAAAAVIGAGWPSPLLLVGLDATLAALLGRRHLDVAAASHTVAARMLAGPLAAFYEATGDTQAGTFPCHDLLAALALVEPLVVPDAPVLPLAIDTGRSAAWGATVADRRPSPQEVPPGFHPWRVALTADEARFSAVVERLLTS